ncbi:hypothetical protein C7212DRAFT_362329 [Tuber magnatum]|uniref:Swiss Army Knife protein DSP-PTPase phosphatase domain-containing protein n=1 Tax=Tuber magnatum TaxID=42249 RepID=A0A317SS57_9PEZI|nr:hypothetical protein C7212DRAFT_362329 [Tuber magnatum]
MFPPGRGNDSLVVGEIYLISLFSTNEMLTAEGEALRLREYQEGHWDQMWVCEKNSDNRYGMRNKHTRRFIGLEDHGQLLCLAKEQTICRSLLFERLSLGGYSIMVTFVGGLKLGPLQRINPSDEHISVGRVSTQFGLHRLKDPVFRRFEWVVPDLLARSSAPTMTAKIPTRNIISLNSVEISPGERGRLRAAKISYSHIKALEFITPEQKQFDRIWNAYDKTRVTIVYCGYGDGRTGMAISAIQLFEGRHHRYPTSTVYST